jgi:PD-(D/E)XK nuclease superfamily protein
VELKAAKSLADENVAQILGYLREARIVHGLLMNFGAQRFEIRKYILSPVVDQNRRTGMSGFLASVFVPFALFCG